MKHILWILPVALLAGCGGEKAELQSRLDSLSVELETSKKMNNTLMEVGLLLDSIDASRQVLRIHMVEGTTYEDYTARMRDLNEYVKQSEKRIADLENTLKKSENTNAAYIKQIRMLKNDLQKTTEEITKLQNMVEKYRNENKNLINLAEMQGDEIADKEMKIRAKEQELALLEARIQQVMVQNKVSEADAYFARAQAVEEAANRTRLAPKKKKETLQEAIELYKKALSLGRKDAQAKIDELQKKL